MAINTNGQVAYEGMVLRTYSQDNSLWESTSYLASVWSEEKQAVLEVSYGGYHWGGATSGDKVTVGIDASPEVRAKAVAYLTRMHLSRWFGQQIVEAKTIRKGKTVKVVRGRKVPVGTVAQVFWMGEGKFGLRLGLKVTPESEALWTAGTNVEVLDPEDYLPEIEDGRADAEQRAQQEMALSSRLEEFAA